MFILLFHLIYYLYFVKTTSFQVAGSYIDFFDSAEEYFRTLIQNPRFCQVFFMGFFMGCKML